MTDLFKLTLVILASRSIARLSASAPSSHDLSLAAFTINIAGSNFRHTQVKGNLARASGSGAQNGRRLATFLRLRITCFDIVTLPVAARRRRCVRPRQQSGV